MRFNPYGDMPEQSVFPQPWATASGESGASLGFVADSQAHPNGIELRFIDQDGGTAGLGHDLAISAAPGNFNSELGPRAMRPGAGDYASFLLRFGPEQPGESMFGLAQPSHDIALTPGATYYLNWRAFNLGTTHGQFFWIARAGSAKAGAPIIVPQPVSPLPVSPPATGPMRITIPPGATYIEIG